MMNVPYVVLKYATLLLSFPINNVVEVVLTTLSAILKCTNNPSHLQGNWKNYLFLYFVEKNIFKLSCSHKFI